MIGDILIVDDEGAIADFVMRILEKEGYKARSALNAGEAIEKIKSEMPDLILLDILMPGVNGFEFFNILKKDESLSDIPVVFMSGFIDSNYIEKAYHLGGVDYIPKPFGKSEILSCIQTHMHAHERQ